MESFIRYVERTFKLQQENVDNLVSAHIQSGMSVEDAIATLTPYQRQIYTLHGRRKQSSTISGEVIKNAVICSHSQKHSVYELGPSDDFNPLSMLETGSIRFETVTYDDDGVPTVEEKVHTNWKQLFDDSIYHVLRELDSPLDIVTKIHTAWVTQFMPRLHCCRTNSSCPYPEFHIRHPIWTARSIVAHLYYNCKIRDFAAMIDRQTNEMIYDMTRSKLADRNYAPRAADIAIVKSGIVHRKTMPASGLATKRKGSR